MSTDFQNLFTVGLHAVIFKRVIKRSLDASQHSRLKY